LKLDIRHGLPDSLLQLEAHELCRDLTGPTLFHVPGRCEPPLFLSVLQHGNETTGWQAVRDWLINQRGPGLPRSLLLFIANPAAAGEHSRMLAGQPDFNRCWPGSDQPESEVHEVLAELTEAVARSRLFASVDIHNNTGRNPHYGACTRLQASWLALARMFDRRVVFFQHPLGVQCEAFSKICPAITVECGLAGLKEGVPHCRGFVDRLINTSQLPDKFDDELNLYHTVARVTVKPGLDFVFGKNQPGEVHFRIDLDALNFLELPAETPLAESQLENLDQIFDARDESGNKVTEDYFELSNGSLKIRRPAALSMLSRRSEIVRKDCFCYVMERMPTPRLGAGNDQTEASNPQPSILKAIRNLPV
jgi:hypothetical protein